MFANVFNPPPLNYEQPPEPMAMESAAVANTTPTTIESFVPLKPYGTIRPDKKKKSKKLFFKNKKK